jgi:hypothetical protein
MASTRADDVVATAAPGGPTPGADLLKPRKVGGLIATIDAIDFVGQHTTSLNGRFNLLWQDRASINGTVRGGRYVLLDSGRLVVDAPMARPQHGKVADNGTFILNDWGASDELSGTFHAFSSDGGRIASRGFRANLLNNGLSDDGALAVVQTCNAPGSPDSSILAVFDLAAGKELACWQPVSGWADGYEFPGEDRVRMIRRGRPPLDYRLDGEFLDRALWYSDGVSRGEHHVIRDALEHGHAVTGLVPAELRTGVEVALADPDDRFRAQSFRLLGEIEELAGDDRAAIEAYRQALEMNPRIGVAKRAAALSKRIGGR